MVLPEGRVAPGAASDHLANRLRPEGGQLHRQETPFAQPHGRLRNKLPVELQAIGAAGKSDAGLVSAPWIWHRIWRYGTSRKSVLQRRSRLRDC